MRSRFRETLWFKKGQSESEAAQTEAAAEGDATCTDTLPVEDRYVDDGSVQPSDSVMFGVHTGTTQAIETIRVSAPAGSDASAGAGVPEGMLVAEMKTGRRLVFAMMGVAALALGGAVAMLTA